MSFKVAIAAILAVTLSSTLPSPAATIAPGSGSVNIDSASAGFSGDSMVMLPTPLSDRPLLPSAAAVPQPRLGVFRSVAISAARLPAAARWEDARNKDQTALFSSDCDERGIRGCDTSFARKLQAVAARAGGLSDRDLLDLVNRSVNSAMRYSEDRAVWGQSDYWATPTEMALKGAGDCEDFAIAKYWMLRGLGIADDQLQMVVLQDTRRRLFHAVLVVHTASGAYVLDNVNNRLQPDTAYGQYHPIMSFAGEKNFIHGFDGGTRAATAMPRDLSTVAPGSGL